ncbi:hypothetical protein L7F22_057663 [Adiantum nelumboides]|nr:hypothetical protein [Adiantum nelumboides]
MEKLAYPAANSSKPLSAIHSLHLHSRFCSILAGVFCFWWVASLLHFRSSTTLFNPRQYAASGAVDEDDQLQASYDATNEHAHHAINIHDFVRADRPTSAAHRQQYAHTVQIGNIDGWQSSLLPSLPSTSAPTSGSIPMSTTYTSIEQSIYSSSIRSSAMSYNEDSVSSSSFPSSPSSSSRKFSPSAIKASPHPSPLASSVSHPALSPSRTTHPQVYVSTHLSSPTNAPVPASNIQFPHDSCDGKYVYIHSLPPMFNQDMISDCIHQSPIWVDICKIASNGGLGPILEDKEGVLTQPSHDTFSWYNTEQFILDVIFHNRMKKYQCLTNDSSKADLIYVPFYAGLDLTRYLWRVNASVRDYLPNALAKWLSKQPEWKAMEGRDHFFVTGKISWDFRRPSDKNSADWGNKLLELPALKDVSVLLIEKGPIEASHVEHAIPYPTYFHPHKDSEIYEWQDGMRAKKRVNLFAFAGASRPEFEHSIRGELIEQCRKSTFCKLLECTRGKSGCNSPTTVMKLFQESVFCLQPSGDSYTRRSVFDSMVSGCIPVLFHPYTVYTQYNWHLPENHSTYSVFIPENEIKSKTADIERILRLVPACQVEEMREKVISLIPSLIYAHPDHQLEKVKDAFDVAMEALLAKAINTNGPFEKWRIDAMGPLPRTANGKLYFLVAIDYMTRFRKGLLTEVCEELKISHRHSTPYYPQSNGLLEKANGIIAGIIKKMVESKPKRWDNFLDGAIWAYRTTYRDATQFTPFHLVYGQEALQPIELNIPTIKLTGRQEKNNDEAWIDRLLSLVELEWKREAAYHCYKRKTLQLKDKLNEGLKDKEVKRKSLVLRYNNALDNKFDAKFEHRWEGPFIVKKAFTGGYYQLMDLNGKKHPRKVNGYRLKPYLSRILPTIFETKQVSKKTKKVCCHCCSGTHQVKSCAFQHVLHEVAKNQKEKLSSPTSCPKSSFQYDPVDGT